MERQHRCGRGADTDRTPLLIDAIDGLARLAAYLKQRTALVIDDLQKIIELGGQTTEPQIRAAIQRHTELGFVFEGSKTELLNDMTLNPALPFYLMGVRHFALRSRPACGRAKSSAFSGTTCTRRARIEG